MNAAAVLVLAVAAGAPGAEPSRPWTLERAIEAARKNNPDAAIAVERISMAEASLQEAKATFWPQVNLGASYSVTNYPVGVFGNFVNQEAFPEAEFAAGDFSFNDLSTNDDLNLQATLAVPLWLGGRRFAAHAAVESGQQAATVMAKAVQNQLAFEVARAYFTVLQARAFIEAAEAAVRAYQANLESAKDRFEAGTLLKPALLDVEVRLSRAQEELVRARNAEALALRALASVMGLEGEVPRIADGRVDVKVPSSATVAQRPELVASSHQVDQNRKLVNAARADYWPQVKAFGSVLFDQGFVNDGNRLSYVAGIALDWKVWDTFGTRARVRKAEAEVGLAEARRRKLRLGLLLEADQARIRVDDARERLAVTEREISLAEESAELTRTRFENGLALSTELIEAETSLTAARVRRAESEGNLRIAIAALCKALAQPMILEGDVR